MSSSNNPNSVPAVQSQSGQGQATQTQIASKNSANNNNNSNSKKRKRGEDQTVSNLRFQWHLYISKILSCKLLTAQKSIKEKCQEVIEGREELKKTVGRMESVIRGKEEEMRGLYLDK
eukprot:CAMPEP_0194079248 /NCGR_PEP_ID=MMETSP0149-20130528/5483_1 /TAXON_ID=122233 /ORGANISM="Chaetoceros debilis, Strain MM31A-1" /LENGTH=117 /DNA_ID=CAMNT_0038760681 /DNA_START=123 /DNA_END=473 /DNA_ORIENTATION=+